MPTAPGQTVQLTWTGTIAPQANPSSDCMSLPTADSHTVNISVPNGLYDSLAAARSPSAEAYRQQVVRDRGPLRGADCILMRELVRAQEALERTQWARAVAQQVQRQVVATDPTATEPRLVRVGSRSSDQRGLARPAS